MVTVAPCDFGEPVEKAAFVGDVPVFALADGTVHFPTSGRGPSYAVDGLLCAEKTRRGDALICGGEDGRVVTVDADGALSECASKPGKWIDIVAAGPDGAIAYGAGRTVWVLHGGEEREFAHERAAEAVTFMPKGLRIAVARYNGVSVHWVAAPGKPLDLHWDGAHTGVTVSQDGRYIVTTMAENALHGWRLDDKRSGDGKHMRMSGYPAKPKSLSWSRRCRWLASSGAPAAIVWPFAGKDGPMGKAPKELGTRGDTMVTIVACHPLEDVVAIGYGDGMVMAVRIEDAAEHLLRRPSGGAVTALCWEGDGQRLAFGGEGGEAGIIALEDSPS